MDANDYVEMLKCRDSLPEHLRAVFEESFRLGTRLCTRARNTEQTLRLYLEPEYESIRDLTVFVSYTARDEGWARSVVRQLGVLGFNVEFFPCIAPEQGQMSERVIEQRLLAALERSDYICMLFSEASRARPWVLYEIEQAARLIGRVVLVRNETVENVSELNIPRFQTDSFSISCVKHTLIHYDSSAPDMALKLARMIINDHDEGVTDGSYRPRVIRERNLKRESLMRRYVREQIGADRRYASRHVTDILPFFLDDLARDVGLKRGDLRAALAWFAIRHGRLNQALHAEPGSINEWEYRWETFPVPKRFASWTDHRSIEGIVVINPRFSGEDKFWSTGDAATAKAQFGSSSGGK